MSERPDVTADDGAAPLKDQAIDGGEEIPTNTTTGADGPPTDPGPGPKEPVGADSESGRAGNSAQPEPVTPTEPKHPSNDNGRKGSGNGESRSRPETSGSAYGTGDGRDPQEDETREVLLNQFYSTLEVMYFAAKPAPAAGVGGASAKQHERINQLFDARSRTWNGAYEIEQLLSFVMTDEQVDAELPRRRAEAKAHKLEYISGIEKQLDGIRAIEEDSGSDQTKLDQCRVSKRYILQRLLNDLQWFYKQRIRRREAAKRLSLRVSALFLSAFLFFFTLLFVQYWFSPHILPVLARQASAQGDSKSEAQDKQDGRSNPPASAPAAPGSPANAGEPPKGMGSAN